MIQGVYTALITPFLDGQVDFKSLENLVEHQLTQGIQGFVVCGTTGESATLTEEEQLQILDFVCKKVDKKVPILFGSGSNSTEKTIQLSQKACDYPIDGLLVVVPYYNKPPQEGLIAHFTKVADSVSKPVVLYNVPGRTVTALSPESIIQLAQHKNIVAIKEADSDLNNFSKYKNQVPDDFGLLSGDDESCVNFCTLGGHGVISVCSHIAPQKMVHWINRAREKDASVRDEFRQQHLWIQSLYISSNPIPTKYALQQRGLIRSDEVRLPLVTMNQTLKDRQDLCMKDFGDLS
jgi:4-hydroxy-tetrahydrodipicolinate synthase